MIITAFQSHTFQAWSCLTYLKLQSMAIEVYTFYYYIVKRDLNNCFNHVMFHCCFYMVSMHGGRNLREFSPNDHNINPWLCFCSENSQLWPAIFLWHLLRSLLLGDNFLFERELFESSSFDVVPHHLEHLCW